MGKCTTQRENCYVTSEALYHLLGGKRTGWIPQVMHLGDGGTHWFLKHKSGLIVDATAKQFRSKPRYSLAKGFGFLTKRPSKRAKALMEQLVWQ